MHTIKRKMTINNQSSIISEIISDKYIVVKIDDINKTIYDINSNIVYGINEDHSFTEVNTKAEANQFISMITEVKTETKVKDNKNIYNIICKGEKVNLKTMMIGKVINDFSNPYYYNYNVQNFHFGDYPLKTNEICEFAKTIIKIQDSIMNIETKLLDFTKIDKLPYNTKDVINKFNNSIS
ncbi:hypothetical protein [Flammeovirga agarivorans]|uniref:Uncharacterized protein n=1 Tax=Flammeovirga agarivorans TaxID=2726742 RepID=A0A7X8XX66_9BACT|nr:hypothetical protein [Flammeovirga agarivorans]NLR92883.1 hypothetical protein [Flammeovirga agarivorans]